MTDNDKLALFDTELSFIHSTELRGFVEYCLLKLPDYFYCVAASASGKYHPNYALGEAGLVRHTKAAVRIARELIKAGIDEWYLYDSDFGELIDKEQFDDEVYAALILHDGLKLGWVKDGEDLTGKHTVHEHPLLMSDAVAKWSVDYKYDTMSAMRLAGAISSHMGKWSISKYSSVVLPVPMGWQARLVHEADLLASRKCLEFNFNTMEPVND